MSRQDVNSLLDGIASACAGIARIRIMEVCGTHTVALLRTGVKSLLPKAVRLVSGPGCPVCVTPQGYIDAACELAGRPEVTVCTYGDMVRVPGRGGSLATMRGKGANVTVVYSARDALRLARKNPERKVVFLAVGFETTTPTTAATLLEAERRGVRNFFVLCGHKTVVPAMTALLAGGAVPLDGFLCPGHVSIVIGADAYRPIAEQYRKPCVVAGFEPTQMLDGILRILRQAAAGEAKVENVYGVAVTREGNRTAREIMDRVFMPGDAVWRAMGTIPGSGLDLRPEFERFDARARFGIEFGPDVCPPGCLCGEVIQGRKTPAECRLFGADCTPHSPVGPCMVSSEGACAAWHKYGGERRAAPLRPALARET